MTDQITPIDYFKHRDEYILLDVREDDELAIAKVSPSLHIPLGQLSTKLSSLDKEQKYVVMCHSGRRSQRAADLLKQQGYTAINMTGGIDRYSLDVDPNLRRY